MKLPSRKECALGIHFDFHARHGMTVGDEYAPETIAAMLDRVRPDFVQVDTKGHAGLSSYLTKAGTRADAIAHEPLRLWREETEKRGIRLYAHHSGLYEMTACRDHPDWAVVHEDGSRDQDYVSVFSPYAEELLLPQIRELAGEYRLDGVWVDGDCWGACVDYGPYARRAWKAATGRDDLPRHEDADYPELLDFQRDAFKAYVARYTDTLHREFPGFEVTSNWIYSFYMPECADVAVDFLSGDYSSTNSVNNARYNARILAAHRMTWDLMAWGQNVQPCSWQEENRQNKEAVQLMQEGAVVVALGGAFEWFDILYGHGTLVQDWCRERWGQVADFVRARQPYCFGAKEKPSVGVLFPKYKPDTFHGRLYDVSASCRAAEDTVLALQDAGYSTGVFFDGEPDAPGRYGCVCVPDAQEISPEMLRALEKYAEEGGVLWIDLGARRFFAGLLPLGETEKRLVYVNGSGSLAAFRAETEKRPAEGIDLYENNYYSAPASAAAVIRAVGKGKAVLQCFAYGASYGENRSVPLTAYLRETISAAGFTPSVRVTGTSLADLTLMEKDGVLSVNLINVGGPHDVPGVRSFGEIPPIGPFTVEADLDRAPAAVIREPEHLPCAFAWDGRTARVTVDRLEIHCVLRFE